MQPVKTTAENSIKHNIVDITELLTNIGSEELILKLEANIPEDRTGPAVAMIDNIKLLISTDDPDIILYPNPATDKLTLKLTQVNETISELLIYNANGLLVKKKNFEDKDTFSEFIDLDGTNTGLHYLKIITDKAIYTKHLIIR